MANVQSELPLTQVVVGMRSLFFLYKIKLYNF